MNRELYFSAIACCQHLVSCIDKSEFILQGGKMKFCYEAACPFPWPESTWSYLEFPEAMNQVWEDIQLIRSTSGRHNRYVEATHPTESHFSIEAFPQRLNQPLIGHFPFYLAYEFWIQTSWGLKVSISIARSDVSVFSTCLTTVRHIVKCIQMTQCKVIH